MFWKAYQFIFKQDYNKSVLMRRIKGYLIFEVKKKLSNAHILLHLDYSATLNGGGESPNASLVVIRKCVSG